VGQSWELSPWLAPVFHITHVTNTGAVFGLFPGAGSFFVVVSAVVIVALLIYYRQLPDGQLLVRIALGLQLGGAVGNLVDRLRLGSVVDFIDLNFWPMHNWAVFNLADSSIVTGVILLTLLMLWEEWQEQSGQRVAADG
jgi:signal peptidase II